MIFDGAEVSAIPDNSTMTREEYKFSLFINRIRDIFKEILIKPMWTQFCIKYPEFAKGNLLRNALGLEFVEENVFALAKEKAILEQGVGIVQSLAGLQNADQTPVFSMKFLLQRYLSLSDEDWLLNKKLLDEEKKEMEKAQAAGVEACILTATMIKEDAGNSFNKQLIPYNEFLRRLAKEKNCLLIDLNDAMQKEVSGVKKVTPFAGDVLTVDGVHMNALGNIMMAKNILWAFGMSNEQLAAAEKMWDEEKFFVNDRIVLSVGDYKKVFRKAAVSGKSVSDYLSELIRKDAE
jgi:hypothetical protein